MADLTDRSEEALYDRVSQIIEAARSHVSRTVNTAMVHAYWLIGREIVEVEQQGKERAEYGESLVKRLAARLTERFGKGFTASNVKRMRQLYSAFPHGSCIPEDRGGPPKGAAVRRLSPQAGKGAALRHPSPAITEPLFAPHLSWTHYRVLLAVADPQARSFYEIEAARESWSTRELERQIASLLYERLAKSRDKEGVLALAKQGQLVAEPGDVLKDPLVLEFLQLEEQPRWLERDLEQAIIDRLEGFLLELGKGFCFVARQKRLTLDGDHFCVDLVLYNRLLRCFVLIDLKLGKLTHQDLGQMQMYVHFFDRHQREEWEAPTVGIVLCSEKNDAMVCITLPEDDEQIHAASYQLYLPTEDQLREHLVAERERLEHARRVVASEPAEEEPGDS